MDAAGLALLAGAYVRRKRFEAKLQANAIWTVLSEAMSGSGKHSGRVPARELLRIAGCPSL